MSLKLDHIVIAVGDLDVAIQDYRDLGFTVIRGGVHANRATHNALVVFADGTYLELLAATNEEPVPGLIDFSHMLRGGEGLVGFALRTDDLDAAIVRLRSVGFNVGDVVAGERQKGDRVMRWKLALIDDGFAPFLIQDITPRDWRVPVDLDVTTHTNHAVGLQAVEVVVRDMDAARDRYARLMGVTPEAHDRTIGAVVLNQPISDTSSASSERGRTLKSVLSDKQEALFAIHLMHHASIERRFSHERTHGVWFEQLV